MHRPRRPRTLAASAASLMVVAAALSGCSSTGGGSSPAGSSAPGGTSAASGAAPATTAAASSAASSAPAAGVVRLTFTIKDGKATPGFEQVPVKLGDTVELTVTSDADDQVHVHGYDDEVGVKPGTPSTIRFTANQEGQFEIETHESNLRLASLVVR